MIVFSCDWEQLWRDCVQPMHPSLILVTQDLMWENNNVSIFLSLLIWQISTRCILVAVCLHTEILCHVWSLLRLNLTGETLWHVAAVCCPSECALIHIKRSPFVSAHRMCTCLWSYNTEHHRKPDKMTHIAPFNVCFMYYANAHTQKKIWFGLTSLQCRVSSNHIFVISEQSKLIAFDPVEQGGAPHFSRSISQLMTSLDEKEDCEEEIQCCTKHTLSTYSSALCSQRLPVYCTYVDKDCIFQKHKSPQVCEVRGW